MIIDNDYERINMKTKKFAVMIAGIVGKGLEEYERHYLSDLAASSQKDKGCLIYNVHQSIEIPSEFMMYSLWENQAAFEEHNQQPHMQEFKKKLVDKQFYIQSPKTYWELI